MRRLEGLARKTGRIKTFYVRGAILRHMNGVANYCLASQRRKKNLPDIPLEKVECRLGLKD